MSETNKEMSNSSVDEETTDKINKTKTVKSAGKIPLPLIYVGLLVVGVLVGVLIVKQPWKNLAKKHAKTDYIFSEDFDAEKYLKLGQYKGITVSIAVTQDDIASAIEDFQDENTKYEEKQGTVQDGNMIYAVFDGYVDGKKVENACGNDYVDIGAGEWFEGFEEAYIGAQTGKEFNFELDVPEDTFDDDAIDGHRVSFKATAQYICGEEIVPEYNDDLVQSATEFKTTAEYEDNLRKELAEENEEDKAETAWAEVTEDAEVKKYPADLMEAAKKQVLEEYYGMADLYGVSHDEIFQYFGMEDEQDFIDTDLEELAQDTVKEQLTVAAIAKKEKIEYTDKDYEAVLKEEYSYNEEDYDSQEAYEKKNKDYLVELTMATVVKDWIADHANFIRDEAEGTQEDAQETEDD